MLGGVRTRHQRAWLASGPGSECYFHQTHNDEELNAPTSTFIIGHESTNFRSRSRIKSFINSRAGQVLLLCMLLLLVLRNLPWFKKCGRPFLGEEWESSPALNSVLGLGDDDEEGFLADIREYLLPRVSPLPADFLANPPRIDHTKLMSRLDILEQELTEDIQDEDETVAYNFDLALDAIQNNPYRKPNSRWPPIIDRVPSITNSQGKHASHEEFTAPIADLYFCGTNPCKVLLPSWSRPLSPSGQRRQLRVLADLAALLNRTLVLPNVGLVQNSTTTTAKTGWNEPSMNWYGHGEPLRTLLALGTCPRTPLAQYYDVTPFLFSNDEGVGSGAKTSAKAVPMQPFIEWVKHRPVHPSAQVLAVDGYQHLGSHKESFHAHETENEAVSGMSSSTADSFPVKVLEGTTYSRGYHKNCLTARVPKLDFKTRSALSITIPHISTLDQEDHIQMKTSHRSFSCSAIIRDIKDIIQSTPALAEPDVLVLEWDLDCNTYSEYISPSHSDYGTFLPKYSLRLELLANELTRPYPKPLVLIHSRLELESEEQLRCLQNFSYILDNILSNSSSPSLLTRADDAKTRSLEVEIGEFEFFDEGLVVPPDPSRGSVWLGEGISAVLPTFLKGSDISDMSSREPRLVFFPSNTDTDSAKSSVNSEKNASLDADTVCNVVPDLFPNIAVTNLFDAVKDYPRYHTDRQTPVGLLSDVMDDASMRTILEDIVTMKADHVLELKC